jgi:hypothetical protein
VPPEVVKKENNMVNPLQALSTYTGDDWYEYLDSISLSEIFKDLIVKYQANPSLLKGIIRYIVWAYSKDSDKITLGTDWLENKKRIFEAAQLPPMEDILKDVVFLGDDIILITIKRWIDFQDDDTWKELMMLKDLRAEMQLSANSPLKSGNGEVVNYDQKFKNAKYSIDLALMIKDCESKLLQNDPKFKDATREVKQRTKSNISISPESFAR